MVMNRLGAALVSGVISATSPTLADDWTAAQLRGDVFVYAGNQWQPLERGSVVPDGEMVKTMAGGHVTFTAARKRSTLAPIPKSRSRTVVPRHDPTRL
jgi:hypothetical protein